MGETEVIVREAEPQDAAGLSNLLAQVTAETDFLTQDDVSSNMSVADMENFIIQSGHSTNQICLLAKVGEKLIGVLNIAASSSAPTVHIGDLFIAVAKPYWGCGIGQLLMEAFVWIGRSIRQKSVASS